MSKHWLVQYQDNVTECRRGGGCMSTVISRENTENIEVIVLV